MMSTHDESKPQLTAGQVAAYLEGTMRGLTYRLDNGDTTVTTDYIQALDDVLTWMEARGVTLD